MIDVATLVTIVGMAVVTYLTRALGFLLLRNRTLGPQLTQVLNAAPGCVLIAVIAPKFVSGHPADLIALGLLHSIDTHQALTPGSRDDGRKHGMTQAPPGAQCSRFTLDPCARPWTRSPT